MKRVLTIAATIMLATVALALYDTGWGKTVTATTTPARQTGFTANTISIINNDSTNDVFTLVDCSTNEFATRLSAGTCIRILPQSSYTFDANGQDSMSSVCYATTNGTAETVIAAF